MAKRTFDLLVAFFGLLFLSPVMVGIAIAILLTAGRPVFFMQRRPGLNGKPFSIVKFRTMRRALTSGAGHPLQDSERLTALGRWLRKTSLDELPGLFNVLRGDMSLVGPRPLLMEYLGYYTPDEARRHTVRPGITGWAQINGRNQTTWTQRLSLDIWYVDNGSFQLDLKIIAKTVCQVFRGRGVQIDPRSHMADLHIERGG
jgi:lipopolysaccharide/colanic/teichoic acid biosynthesis glycosyltransferase